jgi:hypothetical protein
VDTRPGIAFSRADSFSSMVFRPANFMPMIGSIIIISRLPGHGDLA